MGGYRGSGGFGGGYRGGFGYGGYRGFRGGYYRGGWYGRGYYPGYRYGYRGYWPYYGAGWGYPYYGYGYYPYAGYSYPYAYSYPSYVYASSAPAYSGPAYGAPAQTSCLQANGRPVYLIKLTYQDRVYMAVDYWYTPGTFNFVTAQSEVKMTPIGSIDRGATVQLNRDCGVDLQLPN